MAGIAGYQYKIFVSTSQNGTYEEILSTSGSFSNTSDILDDTDTTNQGYHSRIVNLLDSSLSSDVNWSDNNTAQGIIESARENRSSLWVKVLPDGVAGNGKKFPVVVENFDISLSVTDLITGSISLQGAGPVLADDA